MYEKTGTLMQSNDKPDLFIENKDGKVFRVSYIVMYVWDKLDGKTSLESINEDIQSIVKNDSTNYDCATIAQEVVQQLLPCELVKKTEGVELQ